MLNFELGNQQNPVPYRERSMPCLALRPESVPSGQRVDPRTLRDGAGFFSRAIQTESLLRSGLLTPLGWRELDWASPFGPMPVGGEDDWEEDDDLVDDDDEDEDEEDEDDDFLPDETDDFDEDEEEDDDDDEDEDEDEYE